MSRLPDVSVNPLPTPNPPTGVVSLPDRTGFEMVPSEATASVGQQAVQTGARIQQQVDETTVNDTYANKFSPAFRQLYQGYYALQGKDAVSAMPQFQKQMQDLRDQTLQGLGTPEQKNLFSQISNRRIEYEQDSMARYADQQFKVYQDQTHKSTLANYVKQAADYYGSDDLSEHGFGNSLGSIVAEVERNAISSGKPPELAHAEANAYTSAAIVARIDNAIANSDPLSAKTIYQRYSNDIDAQHRMAVQHQVKSAVLPVEARSVADAALDSIMTQRTLTGVGAQPDEPNGMLGLKGDPDEIARQVAAATGLSVEDRAGILAQIERQKAAAGGVALAPNTRTEVMAKIGEGLAKVQQLADAQYPGDPVFADLATSQFMGHLNKLAAATTGLSQQAHGAVIARAAGLDGKPAPLTLQELLSDPAAARAWPLLTPEAQAGFYAPGGILAQNQRQANGEFTRSDPRLVNDLRQRIYLPDGDPNKLTSPTQLTPYFANGLNYTDSERLKKEITESNTPEGNPFLKQVNGIKQTAQKMLTSQVDTMAHPDLAYEGAYRFGVDLDNTIKAYRAAGKNPQSLFTPGSPDYVLDPNRVASYVPTESQVAEHKARLLDMKKATGAAQVMESTSKSGKPIMSNDGGKTWVYKIPTATNTSSGPGNDGR